MNQINKSGDTELDGYVNNETSIVDDVLAHIGIERIFNITNRNHANELLKLS